MSTYKNLVVWQKANKLAYQVYLSTRNFPKDEFYGLTSQLRRAVLSVPTNIVEGYSRRGDKELSRFLNISLGSLAETEYLLFFAKELGYLKVEQYQRLEELRNEVGKLLFNFSKRISL